MGPSHSWGTHQPLVILAPQLQLAPNKSKGKHEKCRSSLGPALNPVGTALASRAALYPSSGATATASSCVCWALWPLGSARWESGCGDAAGQEPLDVQQGEAQSPAAGEERNKPRRQHRLGAAWLGSRLAERDLGVSVGTKLHMSQQRALATKAANGVAGCTGRRIASGLREGILPLSSALVRPHLESCVQCCAPQYKRDVDTPEEMWSHEGPPR